MMEMTYYDNSMLESGIILKRLQTRYRVNLVKILNKAFGRGYDEDASIEMMSHSRFRIQSETDKWYEWNIASTLKDGIALYLVEHLGKNYAGDAFINGSELVFQTGNLAVVRLCREFQKTDSIKCVIDTPGGVIKYSVPVVDIIIDIEGIADILTL